MEEKWCFNQRVDTVSSCFMTLNWSEISFGIRNKICRGELGASYSTHCKSWEPRHKARMESSLEICEVLEGKFQPMKQKIWGWEGKARNYSKYLEGFSIPLRILKVGTWTVFKSSTVRPVQSDLENKYSFEKYSLWIQGCIWWPGDKR